MSPEEMFIWAIVALVAVAYVINWYIRWTTPKRKPHISRHGGHWYCNMDGISAWGKNPSDAYRAWEQSLRMQQSRERREARNNHGTF